MNEEIGRLLDEEIKSELNSLSSLETGSGEKSAAIDDLVKLYKLRIEETKIEGDIDEKYDKRIMEDKHYQSDMLFRQDQLAEQVKDRYFKVGVETASIVLPLIFYAIWMKRGFRFEETGAYTSTTFRGLFNRFRPTNKG